MFSRLKQCSLFQQLIIPMLVVGIVGSLAIIVSALQLRDSMNALSTLYTTGGERLSNLQAIDKAIADYRALSLKHLASERAQGMTAIVEELARIKARIEQQAAALQQSQAQHNADPLLRLHHALGGYIAGIEKAVAASGDFEKESAFEWLTEAEARHLSMLQAQLQGQTMETFREISATREDMIRATERNLIITIAIGILGGGLLMFMAFLVTRRASRRIGDLLAWSGRIAEGDLKSPLVADAGDEIGQLTDAMAGMLDKIAHGRDALEAAKGLAERAAEELRLYENAFQSSGEPMMITNHENRILNVNPAFIFQTGYTLEEVRGKDPKILSTGQTPPEVYRAMWHALATEGYWHGELWDRKKNGEIYPKWISISAIRDERQAVMFYVASFSDISERKANEARIDYLAHHDALTGLINRFNLENRLSQALLSAQRDGLKVAVMFIDMDRFKIINDTLGHQMGDQLLIEVARRLRECVRESDIVARQGGDEFVVALVGLDDGLAAAPVAEKILRRLGDPYPLNGNVLHTSPSIGVALYPDDGDDVASLLKNADTAMYHAKESGRNNVQYFTRAMNAAASERLGLENELRKALTEGQLSLHYQPQVRAGDGHCCGFEALARWHHPTLGEISPLKFIPIAEESGLIESLGGWVLDQACRQLAHWRALGIQHIRVAVNLSAQQLRSADLADRVARSLQDHGLAGADLELEITESAAMDNPEQAVRQLQALRDLGVQLAIDDFGTGYSSLAYLKRLPIHVLKLDRTFVGDIETDLNDAAICTATLALAHNLGLKVVAEGVETASQRDFLIAHQCDYLQGYLYGRPLPAALATDYLQAAVVPDQSRSSGASS
ncbi:MAG: EAL domain-containing protein [Pseudomonadota bacterium]